MTTTAPKPPTLAERVRICKMLTPRTDLARDLDVISAEVAALEYQRDILATAFAECRATLSSREAALEAERDKATEWLGKIHSVVARGNGHGSVEVTGSCALSNIYEIMERRREAEAENARLRERVAGDAALVARIDSLWTIMKPELRESLGSLLRDLRHRLSGKTR